MTGMMLGEFSTSLHAEVRDIQDDFGLSEEVQAFAVWAGRHLFGLEPESLVESLLLYSNSNEGAIITSIDDGDSSGAKIITCWFAGQNPTVALNDEKLQQLLGLWPSLWNGERLPSNQLSEFLPQLRDSGPVDLTLYIVSDTTFPPWARDLAADQGVQLVDAGDLRNAFIRTGHPLYLKEPDALELVLPRESMLSGPQLAAHRNFW